MPGSRDADAVRKGSRRTSQGRGGLPGRNHRTGARPKTSGTKVNATMRQRAASELAAGARDIFRSTAEIEIASRQSPLSARAIGFG